MPKHRLKHHLSYSNELRPPDAACMPYIMPTAYLPGLEYLNWKEMGFHGWKWHPAPQSANALLRAKRGLCYREKTMDKHLSSVL